MDPKSSRRSPINFKKPIETSPNNESDEEEEIKTPRRAEIDKEVEIWKESREYNLLSQNARDTVEQRMRKEPHSLFYIQLSELCQKLYSYKSCFYQQKDKTPPKKLSPPRRKESGKSRRTRRIGNSVASSRLSRLSFISNGKFNFGQASKRFVFNHSKFKDQASA